MTDDKRIEELMGALEYSKLRDGNHPDQVTTERMHAKLRRDLRDLIKSHSGVPKEWLEVLNSMLDYTERIAGGVYSDSEIIGAIRRGQVICHPLVPANIKGSSIDVTLGGEGFWVANANKSPIYDHRNLSDIRRFFRAEVPTPHAEFCENNGLGLLENLPEDALVIPVYPGERILAHTHEFIGVLPPGTTSMQSRSTIGRNGIAVCIDAGWGDPGFATRWAMEIHNFNQELCVLACGDRIAQIVIHHTGKVLRPYGGANSKYHTSGDLEQVIREWTIERMIPRADKDPFIPPLPLHPIPDYSMLMLEEA